MELGRQARSTMLIRLAEEGDAPQIAAIYAPVVRDTTISFETEPPSAEEITRRVREKRAPERGGTSSPHLAHRRAEPAGLLQSLRRHRAAK